MVKKKQEMSFYPTKTIYDSRGERYIDVWKYFLTLKIEWFTEFSKKSGWGLTMLIAHDFTWKDQLELMELIYKEVPEELINQVYSINDKLNKPFRQRFDPSMIVKKNSAKKNEKLMQEEIRAFLKLLFECEKNLQKKGVDSPALLKTLVLNGTFYYNPKKGG